MDGRAQRAQDVPAALPPATPAGRKPKAKAPLPPAETKYLDASSVDDSVESSAFIMEQKENMIDKDIELLVVLPGDIIKSTTVHGSKPMMDLLIFLCAQYHLNPSSHTIDLLSAEKNPIKFKPNTPIGMLEVEKVILKPKILDKKKPTPIIPEKTVRVVINFKKTQKTIVRVSPHAPLEELAPVICSKCEFDPLNTLLLKDYQSQEPLDLTKSLNELGLRELYAMDVSRATSVTAFNKSSLQESCQISQNLDLMKDKENKGFFSLFQRSKKKREQTASAPATPLVSKHRPTFTRSNTITKQYISNTLPSDAPKKRRAPLPPMPGSQRAPQDLAHIQERPASCMVKSTSLDETEESSSGARRVRTGSLQLSSTSGGNSSLKRTKRKAPSPPSKTAVQQSDENSHVTALQSVPAIPTDSVLEANSSEGLSSPESSLGPGLPGHEQCAVPQLPAEAPLSEYPGTPEVAAASLPSGISSDYSLEEIDEKEELSEVPKDEAENTSLKSQDIPTVSTDIINTLKNDPDSALGSDTGESSQNSKEEKQGTRNTDGQGPHIMVCNSSDKARVVDSVRNLRSPGPNQENVDQNEIIVIPTNTEESMKNGMRRTEISVAGVAKSNNADMEVDRLSNYQMQKRVSGHYVTSAAAKSVQAAPNPTPKELIKKELEKDTVPPPEPALSPLSKTTHSPPQPHIQNTDDDSNQKPTETSPPPTAPKPVPLPKSQLAPLNLKTLKTFGAPRPYSSSAPSPFALAVVKRSQSFSKGRTGSRSEEVGGASARAPTDTEGGKIPSVNTFVDIPQPGVKDKENNSVRNEQNPQTPSLTDGPSFTLKRQSSSTFQSSDPEQIRQSLLTAIRSGEAAAKLKRVTVPSNTVSVNGRSRFSHSMSLDAQDGH
ncbi:cordon-bleu protein-like 1 isoform X9 [Mesoplodon densirostris]|uniref:cordon-bleu protein-like 1 isoform X9 n=1 Tax=Mesoplodon densirostris TaxID=48708 RepID=UPI0028DD0514|nr:cordon-bleu protein-like 1 isoform X9 [Mesoplodon densirostris]